MTPRQKLIRREPPLHRVRGHQTAILPLSAFQLAKPPGGYTLVPVHPERLNQTKIPHPPGHTRLRRGRRPHQQARIGWNDRLGFTMPFGQLFCLTRHRLDAKATDVQVDPHLKMSLSHPFPPWVLHHRLMREEVRAQPA